MTIIVGILHNSEVRLLSDTRLTFGNQTADVGSKLYKINNNVAIGLAGVGAYAHHLIGEILSYIDYRDFYIDQLYNELKNSQIDSKIKSLFQIDSTYASEISFLAGGINKQGSPSLICFYIDKEERILKMKDIPQIVFEGNAYGLEVIGSGIFFKEDIRNEIESNLKNFPNYFPAGYRSIIDYIIQSHFSSVGGLKREISISTDNGFRVWHDMDEYSVHSKAGKGFRGIDLMFMSASNGVYVSRMISLIAYMKEANDYNDNWFFELRNQQVIDELLLQNIPRYAKQLLNWHPEHQDHSKIVEKFILDCQKNVNKLNK